MDLVNQGERIQQSKITSNGKYIYYTSRRGKRLSFNIFDVDNGSFMRDLLIFPEDSKTDMYFYSSHDGSKLLGIEQRGTGFFSSGEYTVRMFNIE